MGYRWDPVVRIVPRNGSERVIVFADAFTDLGGHEKADVRYVPDITQRRDVNRVERPRRFGVRPEVRFDLAIMTMADQHSLAEILDALMDPLVDVQLAMDSVTFRSVVLTSEDGPDALAGKPFIGARFRLGVKCAELIQERPRMGETTNPYERERVQNGGMEQWGGAGDALAWSETATGGSIIAQDTVDFVEGASSVKLTRAGGGSLWMLQDLGAFERGGWVRLSCQAKRGAAANNARFGFRNQRTLTEYDASTRTWGSATKYALDQAATASFAYYETLLRMPTDFLPEDVFRLFVYGHNNSAETNYDAVSVKDRVLPTGVALW